MSALAALSPGTESQRPPTRAERRRHLKLVVLELERRQTPPDLYPKQRVAFESDATEILYGGAAGGGKSHLFRRAAIAWCARIRGLQVYIFRREFSDLFKNHMEGPTGFPVLLGDLIAAGRARILWSKNQIRFSNGPRGTEEGGSVIHLCHCQHEKDVYGYQGAEIHVLIIDELTQWTRSMYTFLRSRLRLGALKVASRIRHLFPRALLGANPGGIGHNWVKAEFIDKAPEFSVRDMPDASGGMRRQFIPARLIDNPTMAENDPKYAGRLRGLHDPALAEAMLAGNWDIVAGGMFDDVWNRDVHSIRPFLIPSSWRLDRSFDWGSSRPFSVGWWAESDGSPVTLATGRQRHFPRGTLIRIAEWYGCKPDQPNEGLKMLAVDIAKGIVQRESEWRKLFGWVVSPGPADSSIYDVENGKSIAGDMLAAGVSWLPANKGPGSRKNGWERLRMLLKQAKDSGTELPGMYVFENCTDFVRTVPVLPRDDRLRDDVDTKAEDHIGDETRYRVLAPTPIPWTQTRVTY
jgi:hypothetical protein